MGKNVQDLINNGRIINLDLDELDVSTHSLTSLKGIENFKNLELLRCGYNNLTSLKHLNALKKLKKLYCPFNKITSLKGIENLEKLEALYIFKNKLTSLEGIENLKNLKELNTGKNLLSDLNGIENLNPSKFEVFLFYENPCTSKYKDLYIEEIQEKIKIERHLKQEDDLRGAASMMDTGLFDFKMK